jgi:hypothetical protein
VCVYAHKQELFLLLFFSPTRWEEQAKKREGGVGVGGLLVVDWALNQRSSRQERAANQLTSYSIRSGVRLPVSDQSNRKKNGKKRRRRKKENKITYTHTPHVFHPSYFLLFVRACVNHHHCLFFSFFILQAHTWGNSVINTSRWSRRSFPDWYIIILKIRESAMKKKEKNVETIFFSLFIYLFSFFFFLYFFFGSQRTLQIINFWLFSTNHSYNTQQTAAAAAIEMSLGYNNNNNNKYSNEFSYTLLVFQNNLVCCCCCCFSLLKFFFTSFSLITFFSSGTQFLGRSKMSGREKEREWSCNLKFRDQHYSHLF